MSLTTAQLTALKNDLAADPTFGTYPHDADHADTIAQAYNLAAAGPFYVWKTNVNVPDIFDQVNWANFTPNDPVPTDTVLNNAIWQARAFSIQIKQTNLQEILSGRTTFDASKATQRGGLQDATQFLPSGAAGANRSGGWGNILPILSRAATRAEKLFADKTNGSGAAQTLGATGPATMVYEGNISYPDVLAAWNS